MGVAVLFDLDGTLIESASVQHLRESRAWKDAVRGLVSCRAFDGVPELCAALRKGGRRVAVVTSSVSFYAEAALKRFGIPYDALVAWHDTREHKPRPAPYVEALRRLGVTKPGDVIGVGDLEEDALALRAAGVVSIGAEWSPTFASVTWDHRARYPRDVINLA